MEKAEDIILGWVHEWFSFDPFGKEVHYLDQIFEPSFFTWELPINSIPHMSNDHEVTTGVCPIKGS